MCPSLQFAEYKLRVRYLRRAGTLSGTARVFEFTQAIRSDSLRIEHTHTTVRRQPYCEILFSSDLGVPRFLNQNTFSKGLGYQIAI
jgi:hypothetical protein